MTTASSSATDKPSILIQFDTDPQPSVFDRVVAVDSGVQHLFSYGGMTPANVVGLVHGAIFTRSPRSLARTAIFIGGSDVAQGEALADVVRKTLIPQYGLSVSVMLDSNGANTTAAAAVRAAARHLDLAKCQALILGGTGPVGQRVARLLARAGADVRVGSRQKDRAEAVCAAIRAQVPGAKLTAVATASSSDGPAALDGRNLVVAAGAAGTVLLPKKLRATSKTLKVAIDLNGVPPAGIEGIELPDAGMDRDGVIAYGALGVGDTKMKVHRAAIQQLFTSNQQFIDAEECYALAQAY
ncbi:NADP-dependent methylenetetrahydromethanopterin/methylenetetrahydrofolate dehydrogenase [Tuwongella immobilis]|uniref:Methylene-tetrahydromethanopterin dehydrogenase N-terminal domain-containing protein n=1 Tax=Tuwongella immobilis TaxID=692036 RepID=A0A6C2YVI4_9BACT|nr:NADP-dependent methylenetetrahydromethanopterin/methylenetetrahydrofolate dehydrogenase [Tuwongella immobilis]VIP05630.1 Methylene tetrahydrofolate/methylene tetrahydromethanopterin dehydrogenase-like protein OS=Gemmata sp. Wa1-1 GN=mtdA PE=4 SV=1: Mpt_N: NAD_binding_10 [Tuwongella immobilis]VTS08616.1 Methylene tetrahydrofolate/methylene tetrahydromethanopterin dehydrogenase-like protein OS=Gemmata sp. Wa1-1 GN=mtdA PE=4 SV=1: Mpt_N: NAD_binding_10 [Tuwongella immobilis]